MRITPDSIRYFAHSVRVSLQKADVIPCKVLLRRFAHAQNRLPAARHLSTAESSPSRPLPSDPTSLSSPVFIAPATVQPRTLGDDEGSESGSPRQVVSRHAPKALPQSCPGCGGLSQEVETGEAGYYSRSRKAVRNYLRGLDKSDGTKEQPQTSNDELDELALVAHIQAGADEKENTVLAEHEQARSTPAVPVPICDRCHDLIYQSRGVSIAHPPIDAIADSIAESPFRHNHVFHVLDAADFPLSLIPNIHKSLSLAKPRSQNRRSQHDFSRKPTMSFVITRGDLVAKTKEGIDRLLPYFTSVLRTALGSFGEDMRLGNVHLVSAKRGWWTRDIKDTIWKRGGGNWMVGKANVGKSNLFEVLFPKGSGERAPSYAELQQDVQATADPFFSFAENEALPETSLLPPLQPETPFPVLPLVSSLPGTTASPIRLSFGKHKGELIDLPGLARGNLEDYVHPEHKGDLIMQTRPTVSQHNIKPGQSLLLGGGLVRITPILDESDASTVMLAYAFMPIEAHVTATTKAIATQLQERESGIKSILAKGVGGKMASAGILTLSDDVTKARAAPLLASGVDINKLPFRVFATDILVEGVGWVELACQVRRRRQASQSVFPAGPDGDALSHLDKPSRIEANDPTMAFDLPQVEVFTPEGKHVGQRKTMQAWKIWLDAQRSGQSKKSVIARPRKPMKGAKKREKMANRRVQTNLVTAR
jgi:genetic interactor of prohibitins 3, mitochondrial